ncbi:MAG: hypothetical protein AAGG08_16975, partial [Actinomycetota bacterium]
MRVVVAHWRAPAPEPVRSAEIAAEPGDDGTAAGAGGAALTPPLPGTSSTPARPVSPLEASA